jgi:uncharacterized protein with ACT and thioredoxin-like domain
MVVERLVEADRHNVRGNAVHIAAEAGVELR